MKLMNKSKTLNNKIEIIKLVPRGFCDGVVEAWKTTLDTINKYKQTNQKIYMLGLFVHNKQFVNEINKQGIILLDDSNVSRYQLVLNTKFDKDSILICSAHGTDQKTIELAKQKGLIVVDTVCKYVTSTSNKIKQDLELGYEIILIGKQNHPESVSYLNDYKDIHFVTCIDDLNNLKHLYNKQVSVFNQTTLSIYDLYEFYKFIKANFNNAKLNNEICLATEQRQKAVIDLVSDIDLFLVVGDKKSNNSNSLLKLGSSKAKQAYLLESKSDFNIDWLTNINKIVITSGASTPTWIFNEIYEYILSLVNNQEK